MRLHPDGSEVFSGDLDEVRLSKTKLSNEYLAADYASMTDAFISFGAIETY